MDHIARLPLPWRETAELTECGKPLIELPGERVITLDEVNRRIRDMGKTRASFTACITCMETAERHQSCGGARSGRSSVLGVVVRELDGLEWATPPTRHPTQVVSDREEARIRSGTAAWQRRQRIELELEAIQTLITAHRAEFDTYLAAVAEAPSLTEARARRHRGRR